MTAPQLIIIPDILATWKWPRWHCNPHYEVCRAESQAWFESFKAFSPKAQDAWNRCNFGLLAALSYPYQDKERLRASCDLMCLFFLIDEYTDLVDEIEARKLVDIVMDALRDPHKPRPEGEWVGGEVTKQYWQRVIKFATPHGQKRFIEIYDEYASAVVEQANDRTPLEPNRPSLFMSLPDEVVHHPVIEKLVLLATDMICLENDMVSYNLEQVQGNDKHNVIKIIMEQYGMDVQEAMDYLGKWHKDLERQWNETWAKIPKFGGPIDKDVAHFLDGVAVWVRANDTWSFEGERYFGKQGLKVEKTRKINLLPKELPKIKQLYGEVGPQLINDTLI
jgi:Delta6-protoilludene synthase